MQIAPLHTAEEMQSFSNLAHTVEAVLIGAVALTAFLEAAGYLQHGRRRYFWPALVLLSGVFLMLYMLIPYHGLEQLPSQWSFIFGDPQQQQHVLVAFAAIAAGVAELYSRNARFVAARTSLVLPVALMPIGLMFALHKQHGTDEAVRQAQLIHRYLGVSLMVSGVLRAVEVSLPGNRRWLGYSWSVTLLGAAILLGVYREPKGAYVMGHPHPADTTSVAPDIHSGIR